MQIICRAIAAVSNGLTYSGPGAEVYTQSHTAAVEEEFKKLVLKQKPAQRKSGSARKWKEEELQRVQLAFIEYNAAAHAVLDIYAKLMENQPDETKAANGRMFHSVFDYIEKYKFVAPEIDPLYPLGRSGNSYQYVVQQYQLNFYLASAWQLIFSTGNKPIPVAVVDINKAIDFLMLQMDSDTELMVVPSLKLSSFSTCEDICADFQIPAELHEVVDNILSIPFNPVGGHVELLSSAITMLDEYKSGIEQLLIPETAADAQQEESI